MKRKALTGKFGASTYLISVPDELKKIETDLPDLPALYDD